MFRYTFDGAVKTSRTQALLWRNTGPLSRRCVVSLSSLRIVEKCVVFFQRSRVLAGSQGLKRTKWKIEYAQRRRLRRKINSTSKSEVFSTWAPLPNPTEIEAWKKRIFEASFWRLNLKAFTFERLAFISLGFGRGAQVGKTSVLEVEFILRRKRRRGGRCHSSPPPKKISHVLKN